MTADDSAVRRVLIVEHDESIAELVRDVLVECGYEAEWVLASPRVVAEANRRRPSLIVLDLLLHGEDTPRLLAELGADPCSRSIPVLAITTCTWRERIAARIPKGCNVRRIVTKPFDVEDLICEVRQILGGTPPPPNRMHGREDDAAPFQDAA